MLAGRMTLMFKPAGHVITSQIISQEALTVFRDAGKGREGVCDGQSRVNLLRDFLLVASRPIFRRQEGAIEV